MAPLSNYRPRLSVFLTSVLALLCCLSFASATPRLLEAVIAVVNDDIITLSQYHKKYRQLVADNPSLTQLSEFDQKKKIVDTLILETLVLQVARQSGIRIDDIQFNEVLRKYR